MMKTLFYTVFLIFHIASHGQNCPSLFNAQLNNFLNVRDFTISQTEDEAYFTVQSPDQKLSQIASIKKGKKRWKKPVLLSFCDSFAYLEPFLSPDQTRLYFVSDKPLNENGKRKDFDIWYVKRKNKKSKWSLPINIGSPVNTNLNEFYPTLSKNNNLYFTVDSPEGLGKDDIYFAQWNGNKYLSPHLLSDAINSSGYEFNAFISPTEDYILFSKYNAKDGFGSGDLYMAKKKDGVWLASKNLGININSKFMDYCPFYNSHTKTLYFTSKRIELKPQKFKTISNFNTYTTHHANGLSKIYKINIELNQ